MKFILYGVSIMVLLATAVVGGIFLYVLLRLALVKNCEELLGIAAAHCGMTEREMKMIFREYLKYHAPDIEVIEDTPQVSRGEESCPE